MSENEFESLVALYIEGAATPPQVVRLRAALQASPALRQQFQSSVRLHRAQLSALSRSEHRSFAAALLWLQGYAHRMGRSFAHLCLLALVFVELRVTMPAEYSGLLAYVDLPAEELTVGLINRDMPQRLVTDTIQDFELNQGMELPDMVLPTLGMPEVMPPENLQVNEA